MSNVSSEMNDRVKATLSALLHTYMHGEVLALRFEYISPAGERHGLYTDDYLSQPSDAMSGIEQIHPELVEELKDAIAILNTDHQSLH